MVTYHHNKIVMGVTKKKNEVQTYVNIVRRLLSTIQGPTETIESFRKRLNNEIETVEMVAGEQFFTPNITVDMLLFSKIFILIN